MAKKKAPPAKRTKAEINKEYQSVCARIGQNWLLVVRFQIENDALKRRCDALSAEMEKAEQ